MMLSVHFSLEMPPYGPLVATPCLQNMASITGMWDKLEDGSFGDYSLILILSLLDLGCNHQLTYHVLTV